MEARAFHPEDKSRTQIDAKLAACRWIVQNRDEMNLSAGLGVAVREFATTTGPADYGLFVDRIFCGVIEAKPAGTTLSGFSEQASGYLSGAPEHLPGGPEQRRFEYVASDTEAIFRDLADPEPRSRPVFTFHRPETLRRWLSEPETLRARLRHMPPLATDGLRACQVEAIEGLERSLARDDPRALIQMTMGAGKTFTACTASYRLLACAGARRILFLVDRRNLGNQTASEYAGYHPPGTGRLFTELYGVQKLGPAGLDDNSAVVISTIQRVYSVLTGKELAEEDEDASAFERADDESKPVVYNPEVPIETFDLIVTDEWVWAKARDFARIVGGGTPKSASDKSNFDPDGFPWITPADLSGYTGTHISRGARSLSTRGLSNCSARPLPDGSLLISSRAPVGYCVVAANDVTTNQGFKSLVFKGQMCPEFLRHYVVYNRRYFVENASGTTFKELSGEAMSDLLFPIAPLAEQRRIVARIDELFTEIADGEASLTRARNNLNTWRHALLKAAVTGELTREWRGSHVANETGELLLRTIRASKSQKSRGRRGSRELEAIELPDIPETWAWATIDDLIAAMEYGTSEKCNSDASGLPVLRMGNIQAGEITFENLKYLARASANDAPLLALGDILFNRTNSEELVGKSAVVDTLAAPSSFASYLIRLKA